jgi:hypothetical protein
MTPEKFATGSLSTNMNYGQYCKYHITLQEKKLPGDRYRYYLTTFLRVIEVLAWLSEHKEVIRVKLNLPRIEAALLLVALGAVLVVGHVLRRRRVVIHRRRLGRVPLFSSQRQVFNLLIDPTSLNYLLPWLSTVIGLAFGCKWGYL